MEAGEEPLAYLARLADDAADPGYGNFCRQVVLAAEFLADQQDVAHQIRGGLFEDAERDCVALFGQFVDGRSERGEIRAGASRRRC